MKVLFKSKIFALQLSAVFLLGLFFSPVFGQYGPMGIGNATGTDNPSGTPQPKLLLWLDGSTPTNGLNTDVLTWIDKSGNGNDFSAVAATSPILRNAGPNGRRYLEFSKADNRMSLAGLDFTNQGVSIFYITRTNDTNYGLFSFAESDANPRQILTSQIGSTYRFTVDSTAHATTIGNMSNPVNTWRYVGFVWDGVTDPTYWHRSSGINAPELSQNNILTGESSIASGTAVIGHIQNLLNGGYVAADAYTGDVAEIFVFDGKLNKAMLRMVNTYFRNKYEVGGTGSWDKLQAPSTYREGMIMIARDDGSDAEHRHSRADGLVLRANTGGIQGTFAYLGASHAGVTNAVVATDLPVTVQGRWERDWWIRKDGLGNASNVQIAFDFGEGINGEFPQNASNYVLLSRAGTSGLYSITTVSETFVNDDELVFRLTGTQVLGSPRYYTIGSRDIIQSSLTGQTVRSWFAYQSGNWSDPLTWTLDGSAAPYYVNPGAAIPGNNDAVTIGSGRSVLCDLNNRLQSSLQLFGTLDLDDVTGSNFGSLSGNGLLRCRGNAGISNFPLGNTTLFADGAAGGTVEFYGTGFTISTPLTLLLNKVRINLSNSSSEIILATNFTHNGFFEINQGTFRINQTVLGATRTLLSNADVLVEGPGRITVSSPDFAHVWTFNKNFSNEGGEVRFTQRNPPLGLQVNSPETTGRLIARFASAVENQNFAANGLTYLSRLVVNKGTDATYVLTLTAANPNELAILGQASSDMGASAFINESGQTNSVAIINGTLEARENVFLPLQSGSGNYNINNSASLWINGGFAAKGAPDVGSGNSEAIVPYGTLKISAGSLNANCTSGITTRANGVVQVDGGILNANQLRTSIFGAANIGGIIINGGVLNIDGTKLGGVNGDFYTLSLTFPGNLFIMTGGELRVAGPSGKGLIYINSNPENTNVTGGTIFAEVKNTTDAHKLTSVAPLWNLEILRSNTSGTNRPVRITGGTSGNLPDSTIIVNQPLIIRNNLTIRGANAATLRMESLTSPGPIAPMDLYVQGNMVVENGGNYQHLLNTTYFDGSGNSLLSLPTIATETFHNMVVDKDEDSRFVEIVSGNLTALEVQGDLRLERGSFINNAFDVRLRQNVVNRTMFGDSLSIGKAIFLGITGLQQLTSDGGIFHSVELSNSNGLRLLEDGLTVRRTLTITNGNFYIGDLKLRMEGLNAFIVTTPALTNRLVVASGNASAGGLEQFYFGPAQSTLFPFGVELAGPTAKYTPATIAINSGFVDAGYIRVVPVDEVLPTSNLAGGPDFLSFYWKVAHSDFNTLPIVSHQFTYHNSNINGSEAFFASGRVLNDAPFLREVDSASVSTDHVLPVSKDLFYNELNANVQTNLAGPGTPLVNASYSAGNEARFTGSPKVFYSISSTLNAVWNNPANWSELGQFSVGDDIFDYHTSSPMPANTLVPGAGDIAFIGFNPATGRPHHYEGTGANITASEVRFTPLMNASFVRQPRFNGPVAADITVLRPTLSFAADADIDDILTIAGEGTLLLRGNANLNLVDIGGFLSEDSSIVAIQSPGSGITDYAFIPANVPNLFVTAGDNGSDPAISRFGPSVLVRNNLEVVGNAKVLFPSGTNGNIRVNRDVILHQKQSTTAGSELQFLFSGTPRILDVRGNFIMNGNNSRVRVLSPNATLPQIVHNLIVWGDIIQNLSNGLGFDLSTGPTDDFIALTLRGVGTHSFIRIGGDVPKFGRITLDKGISTVSTFTFNSEIIVNGPTNLPSKAVSLQNGLLRINNATTDILLSSGGGDFEIPASAGLELNAGTLRITGLQTGLLLSGALNLTGGLLEIGNAAENNFLEYSAGGTAIINVSGGILRVGSQLRRGLTNTSGVLEYVQTGGAVEVGRWNAPNANRGVFEVVNPGSRFEHTGGTLTLVQGVNSAITPSFRVETSSFVSSGTSQVIVGSSNSPTGPTVKNVGLLSSGTLRSLRIDNSSTRAPIAKAYIGALRIGEELIIDTGATLDCINQNLLVKGDIANNGVLNVGSSMLELDHNILNNVGGSGVFTIRDLTRIGGGVTTVGANLLVTRDFSLDDGNMNFGANTLTVQRTAQVDGSLNFIEPSQGLLMNGPANQTLRRSAPGGAAIDILTIDNPLGISQIASAGHNFLIGKQLRLKRGILNLRGNLMVLETAGNIIEVNSFGVNNMITTGGAFTNFGIQKKLIANVQQDLFMPLGIDVYMPVRLVFSGWGGSLGSGSEASSYLFRLSIPQNEVIVDNPEVAPCNDPIDDTDNVLQMNFFLGAQGVSATNLRMNAEFNYDQSYVAVTAPNTEADYISARVVDNIPVPDVFKASGIVNPVLNTITFSFTAVNSLGINGDYFAGIDCAIPDNVPLYETNSNGGGFVNAGGPGQTYATEVDGGGAPNGAVIRVVDTDTLNFNVSGISFYKTIIDENAVVQISNTNLHRLGIVEGTGTIRLENTGNLPSGNYNDFFTCLGGKLEYSGTSNREILSNIPIVRRVTLSGSNARNLSNNDVNICEDLIVTGPNFVNIFGTNITIEGDLDLNSGTVNNGQGVMQLHGNLNQVNGTFTAGNTGSRTIDGNINMTNGIFNVGSGSNVILKGNFTKTAGTFTGGTGSIGRFIFRGTSLQFIDGDFDTPTNDFTNLEIDNPSGLQLRNTVDIATTLFLTNGNIFSGQDSLLRLVSNTTVVVPATGSPLSFVDGPMDWTLTGLATSRIFPVGKNTNYRPLQLANRSATRTWTVEYFDTIATVEIPVLNVLPILPTKTVSQLEYWKVNSNSASNTTARVNLSWGASSVVSTLPADYGKLVVLDYNEATDVWDSEGGGGHTFDVPTQTGNFLSANPIGFTEKFITLGSSDNINPLPVTFLYFAGQTNGIQHTLSWATATETNNDYFQLERSIDGRFFQSIARIEGVGNSTKENRYSYVDNVAPSGRVYYRLKQVDFDGQSEYAREIVTLMKEESSRPLDFVLYPNPTRNGEVRMNISEFQAEMVMMAVYDLTGKLLQQENLWIDEQGISQPFNCNYEPGIYLVSIIVNDQMKSKPLVISR